jgi:murein DD-endopeptidase MepM/ murein hydrolase activator NlpD
MNIRALGALAAALALVGYAAATPAAAAPLAASPHTWLDPPVPVLIAALFERPASDWGPGHRGIDLWLDEGSEVRSPGDGVVTFAGDVAGIGIVVVLHPSGLRSTLEPVSASVQVGESVVSGATLGSLELTGSHCAPRACLHWGVRRGDEYLDPLDVLRGYGPIRLLPLLERAGLDEALSQLLHGARVDLGHA